MYILSKNVCAYVCMSENARSMHFSVRALARARTLKCVLRAYECACECARAAGAATQHDRATSRCDSPCGHDYV